MKTGILLQVRLASKRLHQKALLPLPGGGICQHALRALARMEADVHAVLTDELSAPALGVLARREGFEIVIGPEHDVLGRFALAARFYRIDTIIRATGDNPLVSARMGKAILDIHRKRRADLCHYLGLPLGTGVEIIDAEALYAAEKEARDPYEREHITTYLYRHRDRFKVVEEMCPDEFRVPDAKVSIDTAEEYEFVTRIYRDLYRNEPIEISELVAWLRAPEKGESHRENIAGTLPDKGEGNRSFESMFVACPETE
jgi:spore coat polysaccharide biosynthesis protein SpsF